MAKPELEGGFLRIANELLEIFCGGHMTYVELRTVLAIIRFTWGYNEKTAPVSLKKLMALTGIKEKGNMSRIVASLVDKGIVSRNGTRGQVSEYGIIKDYESWVGYDPTVITGYNSLFRDCCTGVQQLGVKSTTVAAPKVQQLGADTLLHERHVLKTPSKDKVVLGTRASDALLDVDPDNPILTALWKIPGWKQDAKDDLSMIVELQKKYPKVNLEEVADDLRYEIQEQLKGNSKGKKRTPTQKTYRNWVKWRAEHQEATNGKTNGQQGIDQATKRADRGKESTGPGSNPPVDMQQYRDFYSVSDGD